MDEAPEHGSVNGCVDVGVISHDVCVVSAEFHRRDREVLAGGRRDTASDFG